ncbi:hypothetical protein BN1012_Phect178 [Candidatus Phaeomarinobacter ectocarpi]|uniref:Uncharacterized protein n=1 Tax=Candidatus Phaeomarinibacter ectocarpi TaxID=1458461 RepID=X5MBQ0_9HYPH|nr:hypothetical protein BN1012_Phect178 [Candidatus Phaeomarinobacter ectocarpi]
MAVTTGINRSRSMLWLIASGAPLKKKTVAPATNKTAMPNKRRLFTL